MLNILIGAILYTVIFITRVIAITCLFFGIGFLMSAILGVDIIGRIVTPW